MFVLNVDLWDAKGENEVNLVRSSQGAPSISATSPFSYGGLNGGDANGASYSHQVVQSGRDQHYGQTPAMAFGQDYQAVPPGYASGTSTCHHVGFSGLLTASLCADELWTDSLDSLFAKWQLWPSRAILSESRLPARSEHVTASVSC